jgi:uncharacterized protein YbjT (DUF2867 family)
MMLEQTNTAPLFVTGGTGFVGANVIRALGNRPLRLLVRDRAKYRGLISEQVELVEGDVTNPDSLRSALDGCTAVLHLVAIIEPKPGESFDGNIRKGTENVLNEAHAAGASRFFQMSAIGAQDNPDFPYHQAKWRAEQAVKASGLDWTIFRPSVIYGPGDGLISVLAGVIRSFPIIPVVGDGKSRFQPIEVGDVAEAIARAIEDPSTAGQTLDLVGPDILTYEEMLDTIAAGIGKEKRKLHLPVGLMNLVVAASRPLPKSIRPPVTSEQLKMLALDNTSNHPATAELLGRAPVRLADNLGYLMNQ